MENKLYNKKIIIILIITAVFAVGTAKKSIVTASESYQIFTPKSYGRLIYDDGDKSNNNGREHDIEIDASDFVNLAKNADSLAGITNELVKTAVRKTDIIDTLEAIKGNVEEDKVVGANAVKELMQVFQDGVNKICDKLSGLGFTPSSNSPDSINEAIQNIYDNRYSQGYVDGLGQAQSANAQITYTYHEHTGDSTSEGGCYTVEKTTTVNVGCDGRVNATNQDSSGHYYGRCSKCGAYSGNSVSANIVCPNANYITQTYYELGCGMSTNTIVSAVIDFCQK